MQLKLPFWATGLTILGIAILCALGTWQLHRLAWKKNTLNQLQAAYDAPIDLNTHAINGAQNTNNGYIYGTLTGTLIFDQALLYGFSLHDGAPGNALIIPLKTDSNTTWLVNLGWISQDIPLQDHPLKSNMPETITISGLARKPQWNIFTPQNKPEENLWYRLYIDEIKSHTALDTLSPYVLYAQTATPQISTTLPNNTRWQPNNNHLQYALFWFSLAAALMIIYSLRFIRKR